MKEHSEPSKEETKTDKELIAEFMGLIPNPHRKGDYTKPEDYLETNSGKFGHWETPCYDTSWDWLMPVVEKIEQFQFDDGEYDEGDEPDTAFLRRFKGGMVRINRFPIHHYETKIEACHAAVVEFIKWYNDQKK